MSGAWYRRLGYHIAWRKQSGGVVVHYVVGDMWHFRDVCSGNLRTLLLGHMTASRTRQWCDGHRQWVWVAVA